MDDDRLVVTSSVKIPRHELVVRFSTSGGPGGQHANKTATRAELVFDVEASGAFSDAQRDRVRSKLGSVVRVVADDERSQLRNRALAEERLVERLRDALHVDRPRRSTRPTRRLAAATDRRQEAARRDQRARQRPSLDDD